MNAVLLQLPRWIKIELELSQEGSQLSYIITVKEDMSRKEVVEKIFMENVWLLHILGVTSFLYKT